MRVTEVWTPSRACRLAVGVLTGGPVLLLFMLMAVRPAVAADDTTPPSGTVAVEGGAEFTNSATLQLDVPATDDVGVTVVRVRTGSSPWVEHPYAPRITYSLDQSWFSPGSNVVVFVQWADAAGNTADARDEIFVDWSVPELLDIRHDGRTSADGLITFSVFARDEWDGRLWASVSSDGGAHWGPAVRFNASFEWNALDPGQGGNRAVGLRTVAVKVRDYVGNWSNVLKTNLIVKDTASVSVSSNPVTGSPVTLSLHWDHDIVLPSDASCLWTLGWGDDESIINQNHNDSYGFVLTQGLASRGFCRSWTLTLPWTPLRRYVIEVQVSTPRDGELAHVLLGTERGGTAFAATVGSTSRLITVSSLPLFHVVQDGSAPMRVGEPAVFRGYAVGGASIRRTDRWSIQYVNVPEEHPGSSVLTFYPKTSGHITVCLYREFANGAQISACTDPTVQRAAPRTTTPTQGAAPLAPTPAASEPARGVAATLEPQDEAGEVVVTPPSAAPILGTDPPPAVVEPLNVPESVNAARPAALALLWSLVLVAAIGLAAGLTARGRQGR
jgi:hypothetical protein